MIEVKGTRNSRPERDPGDPLNLHRPEAGAVRALAPVVGALVGVALYLRSFLGSSAEAASGGGEAAEGDGRPGGEDAAPRARPVVKALPQPRPAAEAGGKAAPAEEEAAGPGPLPKVFGPFESAIISPVPAFDMAFALPHAAANANTVVPPPPAAPRAPVPEGAGQTGPAGAGARPAVVTEDGIEVAEPPPGGGEPAGGAAEEAAPVGATAPPPERNRAPRNAGPVYLGEVGSGATLAIALSHLLANSSDPDGDPLSVTAPVASVGTVEARGSGWRYHADTERLGEVEVTFEVSDGRLSVAQRAILRVTENELSGTEGDDLIVGRAGRDAIRGGAGDDNLAGLGGRDIIHGDEGDDNIAGGPGNDTLSGGAGDDVIAGGAGDDWISGGAGADRLHGEDGADVIYGDAGGDLIDGGAGDDLMFGGEGDDLVDGGAGADHLDGGAGNDTLSGGADADVLVGAAGEDLVRAGEGDDLVLADDDGAADHYDGGAGQDRLDYSAATEGVTFDLAAGTATGASVGTDSFESFEHFVGSAAADTFLAGPGSGTFTGNGGGDLYAFVQGDALEPVVSVYRITDFGLTDRIWVTAGSSTKKISKAQKTLEERIGDFFEDFAQDAGVGEPRLRYTHDWTDEYRRTLVEVDFDRDERVDLSILLDGEHALVLDQA
ncbi:MAG: cadherin-like domain-containing protein [Rhodobacteraceae bacterium]|nr:cadherin-like domain-containing protein [Paracoccaceae bacterium]